MNRPALLLALTLITTGIPSFAATLACPDLSQASQVNACPTEEELKHTYSGYCSDDKKVYGRETDNCLRYKDYRAMKNTALWESQEGDFSAYVSCDLHANKVKDLKAKDLKIEQQGSLTKVVCTYPNNITFTYRTKATCKIADENACKSRGADCRANCE